MQSFIPKQKLAFLPNPLKCHGPSASVSFAEPTLITVTRLVEQKGVDVLLKAAALAFNKVPDWQLAIIGEGPLRHELQALANKLGIAERVYWYGQVDNPIAHLKAADAFILTSRFEGSPNALLEAMACGLPPIVSDASPGPLELVGKEAGLIVPTEDVEATAEAMVALASDDKLRKQLGAAALERTRVHELDNAMRVWRELLRV
jgi:glycosyltransferase involved in cell wall biosynthesis